MREQAPKWNSLHSLPQQSVWSLRSMTKPLIKKHLQSRRSEGKLVQEQASPWLRRGIPDLAYGTSALYSRFSLRDMLWLGKWNISIFQHAILMELSMHRCILSTHPTLLSRCTQVGPSCSHPITHNSPCCNISLFKLHSWSSQCSSLLTLRSTGLKMIPCVSMTPTGGKQRIFFVASAFRPVWPGCCIRGLVCVPRPTRTLDQGGVEPRLAVSLRPEGHRQYHYSTDAPPPVESRGDNRMAA